MTTQQPDYSVNIDIHTKFIFSSSGSASSIVKHNDAIRKLGLNLFILPLPTSLLPKDMQLWYGLLLHAVQLLQEEVV